MMSGELAHTSVFADTSRPVSPPTFTDLQSIQAEDYDNFLHHGAASYMTDFNREYVHTFLGPVDLGPEEWSQGEVRRQRFAVSIKLHTITFALLYD